MGIQQNIMESFLMCTLFIAIFETKLSQAAPSSLTSEDNRNNRYIGSPIGGRSTRTARSTNEEDTAPNPVIPHIRDLPW